MSQISSIFEQVCRTVFHHANRLGPQEWLVISAAMIIVALVCLRGFGSRSGY